MASIVPREDASYAASSFAPSSPAVKILFLAADPFQITPLGLDEEMRAIDQALHAAAFRDQFVLIQHWAVRVSELQSLLLRHQPHIVHFSGHGSANDTIILQDDHGRPVQVSTAALSQLFGALKDDIRCVVLNACYTAEQAAAIAQHIDAVVGMSSAIGDKAAREFSAAFYQALGYGRTIQSAFELGCAQLALTNLAEADIPQLLAPHIDPAQINFAVALPSPSATRAMTIRALSEDSADDEPPELDHRAQRNRRNMLRLVRDYWVDGVLQQSLYQEILLELGMANRDKAVHPNLWDMVIREPGSPNRLLPPGSDVATIFEETGRSLLLLGEPGSGKTTTMLTLARSALEIATAKLQAPIPVVLSLASWADKRLPLAMWLILELRIKYGIPERVAQNWVAQNQLMLLLDGLDQVQTPYGDDCIRAINAFREEHELDMVVCCRTSDYERLAEPLQLRCAVVLQPLTSEQVEYFLAQAGLAHSAWADELRQDPTLWALARSPLMLSIMCLSFDEPATAAAPTAKVTDQRQLIFEQYATRVLERRRGGPYDSEQARHWLTQLASGMRALGLDEFFIEQLQPTWLVNKRTRLLYEACVRLSGGLIFVGGCIVARLLATLFLPSADLLQEMTKGLSVGLLFWLPFAATTMFARFIPGWLAVFCATFLLIIGSMALGLVHAWQTNLLLASLVGLPAGLAGISFGARASIQLADQLTWSWRRGVVGIGIAVVLALLWALVTQDIKNGLNLMVYIGPVIVALLGITHSERVQVSTASNQGIWRSAFNAGFAASFMFLSVFVSVWMWNFLAEGDPVNGALLGLTFGLPLGIIAGFALGGVTCLQHSWLRLFLAMNGRLPLNCQRFLDFAADRLLLNRVGGGYRFIHSLLLEQFLKEDQPVR